MNNIVKINADIKMSSGLDHDIFIFLCSNRRSTEVCCGSPKRDNDFNRLKKFLAQYKQQFKYRVKLNQTGCLGRCTDGPNLVIFPDNIWFKYQSYAELEKFVMNFIFHGGFTDAN